MSNGRPAIITMEEGWDNQIKVNVSPFKDFWDCVYFAFLFFCAIYCLKLLPVKDMQRKMLSFEKTIAVLRSIHAAI